MLAAAVAPTAGRPMTLRRPDAIAAIPGVFAVALLLPSVDYLGFPGVPLGPLPAAVLLLLVPLLASPALRRRYRTLLQRRARLPVVVLIAGVGALGAKGALLASDTHDGFLACYATDPPRPGGDCEASFANPLGRFDATRVDRDLDFGVDDKDLPKLVARPFRAQVVDRGIADTNWDLGFVNSLRLDRPSGPQAARRARPPLAVRWRGEIDEPRGRWVYATYTGEGRLRIGGRVVELPPHYTGLARTVVALRSGVRSVSVDYAWRPSPDTPAAPYATFQLAAGGAPSAATKVRPLAARPPPLAWRALAQAVDVVILAFAASLLVLYAAVLAPRRRMLALVAAAVAAGALVPAPGPLPEGWLAITALATLLAWLVVRRRPDALLLAYLAVPALVTSRSLADAPVLDGVLYRSARTDWLAYESHARSILEGASLQGGEDVFHYQPGFRYVLAAGRLLLGEGDPVLGIVAVSVLTFAVFFAALELGRVRIGGPRRRIVFVAAAVLAVLLVNAPTTVSLVRLGASEWVTWACLVAALPLLVASRNPRRWYLAAALAGLALVCRTNQIPAILFLIGVFAWGARRVDRRAAVTCVAIVAAFALLPAVHNLVYGGELTFLPTGRNAPENLVVPGSDLPRALTDAGIRDTVGRQVANLLYLREPTSGADLSEWLRLLFWGLALAWLAALVVVVRRWSSTSGVAKLLCLAPVAHLLPYVSYDAEGDFPRHLVAGYLTMGTCAMFASTLMTRPRRPPSPLGPADLVEEEALREAFAAGTDSALVVHAGHSSPSWDVLVPDPARDRGQWGAFSVYVLRRLAAFDVLVADAALPQARTGPGAGVWWQARTLSGGLSVHTAYKRYGANVVLAWQAGSRPATDARWEDLDRVLADLVREASHREHESGRRAPALGPPLR